MGLLGLLNLILVGHLLLWAHEELSMRLLQVALGLNLTLSLLLMIVVELGLLAGDLLCRLLHLLVIAVALLN